jgi:hypothetical protein
VLPQDRHTANHLSLRAFPGCFQRQSRATSRPILVVPASRCYGMIRPIASQALSPWPGLTGRHQRFRRHR